MVGPSDTPKIGPVVWGSDPSQSEVIEIGDWREHNSEEPGPFIVMEGNKVFRWATTFIADKAVVAAPPRSAQARISSRPSRTSPAARSRRDALTARRRPGDAIRRWW